ncbi:hypothetical protein ES332_D08G060600v1 [Gossypium tomentosum]|nr:hypothetical protein ES332_D08G060600v1 [Gossypium tomentosum]
MGQAISKTVAIAEIIKKRVPQLHQDTAISSLSITDVWDPIEEGLVPVEMTRHVSMISITLSTGELNKNSAGYQPPHFVEESKPQYHYHQQQPQKQARIPYNSVNEDNGGYSNWGRGGGRGRGWGYRGSGYERGRRGGGRGYNRGRGRMRGGRSRGGGGGGY